MKAVDYGICFCGILMTFLVVWWYKEQILVVHTLTGTEVNDVMDEIVRDSLEKTIMEANDVYEDINYMENLPKYKENLISNLKKEMEFVFAGTCNEEGSRLMETRIEKAFLLWGDIMYVYDLGGFTEIIIQGDTEAERYIYVMSLMEEACGHSLNIPMNDYESNNKIGEYSFSVVYNSDYGSVGGGPYTIKCFSSAKIKMQQMQ